MTDTPAAAGSPLDALLGWLRGPPAHHWVDGDNWYSCPKAPDGCADDAQGTECNCGAEDEYAQRLAWADELSAANERIRCFDQTDSASCVGTGCKASSLAAELSACRAELAAANERHGKCSDTCAQLHSEAKALRMETAAARGMRDAALAAKEQSERLLAAAAKDADALREKLRYSTEMLEESQSGYISGSGPDMEWNKHRDQQIADSKAALASKESPK